MKHIHNKTMLSVRSYTYEYVLGLKKCIIFLICIMCSICFFSCKNSNPIFDAFFEELQDSVGVNHLLAFKNAPEDSTIFYFKQFEVDFLEVYNNSPQKPKMEAFFDRNHVRKNMETRSFFLAFSFHRKLNNKDYNFDEVVASCDREFKKVELKFDLMEKKFRSMQDKIIQLNDKKYSVGDKLNIILPVTVENGIRSARYCSIHSIGMDCYDSTDSLKITGKLLEKEYDIRSYRERIDTITINFKLKILNLSNKKYYIFDKEYKVGDTLDIYLHNYGKLIL